VTLNFIFCPVVIPAYRPPRTELLKLLRDLRRAHRYVVVVDDNSGLDYNGLFDEIRGSGFAPVLRHVVRLGKGAALRTGLNYAACTCPQAIGFVTADADGQHTAADILRVIHELSLHPRSFVLGVRTMDRTAPLRSRAGNAIARAAVRIVAGGRISDAQTGLRGIPIGFLARLLRIRAVGYDWEIECLIDALRSGYLIREVEIETVYRDGNRGSHFRPLHDSMRIGFALARNLISGRRATE
jgi:glycosyltransferase involved in cell wall biosynthesis